MENLENHPNRDGECPRCSATLPRDAPDGFCPKCLALMGAGRIRSLALSTTQSPISSAEGQEFGDYSILEEIARGGMGTVFKARQRNPNRVVALKIIVGGPFAGDELLERFRIEIETVAQLSHPNII